MIDDHLMFALDTYLVLAEDNQLGEPPTSLGGGERWYQADERERRRTKAYTELASIGMFRGGRVDAGFLETVRVLQRPGIEYYTFARLSGQAITSRAAAIGKDSVLAVCDGTTVELYPGELEQLAAQLVWSLPDCEPASVHSLSCVFDDFQAASAGEPVLPGQSGRDAKQMIRWTRLPHDDGGQLFTAVRKSGGGRRRSGPAPRWFDTEQGRILVYLDASGYLNLVPGSVDKLVGRLQQMEKELR